MISLQSLALASSGVVLVIYYWAELTNVLFCISAVAKLRIRAQKLSECYLNHGHLANSGCTQLVPGNRRFM